MASLEEGLVLVGLGLLVALVFLIATAVRSARKIKLTTEERAALSPALQLSRIERAYLDSWLVIDALPLADETKDELLAQLNGLVEEEKRLGFLAQKGVSPSASPEEISLERDRLRQKLETASDPTVREALLDGLQTCERRLTSARGLALAQERIDAQLDAIGQAIGDVRDGLIRMRLAPEMASHSLELEPIRQTLAQAKSHTAAIESAMEEVYRT
jgi:hypothetical protein